MGKISLEKKASPPAPSPKERGKKYSIILCVTALFTGIQLNESLAGWKSPLGD